MICYIGVEKNKIISLFPTPIPTCYIGVEKRQDLTFLGVETKTLAYILYRVCRKNEISLFLYPYGVH